MSRIGKKPVTIPDGVTVAIAGSIVHVKGPKGALDFSYPREVKIGLENNILTVTKVGDTKKARSIWGTITKLIANMIAGVTIGFQKQLELNGVGFRMAVAGEKLTLALGFSHPVVMSIPEALTVTIENNIMTISGIDKQQVGEFSAVVRKLKKVEPYKGKGFRYVGEIVRRKEGKKAATAA
ncbi:MAG TPA: 50S ribosomal protein L6 [Patescibacteria group bacterium]|nr:50S ribosomal protein L6 [Patescibacteria group bacterium]